MVETSNLLLQDLDSLVWASRRPFHASAWHGHVSFAHWIVPTLRPGVVVELGTHNGVSFAAFCNAVSRSGLPTKCFAVDSWTGDSHSGHYGEEVYNDISAFVRAEFRSFANLLRCDFDAALSSFADSSIDLLHIDGLHSYEAVSHDFHSWQPKLSQRAVVLFHDTMVHEADFGVWRLWDALATQYPSFNFTHSFGLGVLAAGPDIAPQIAALCRLVSADDAAAVSQRMERLSALARRIGKSDVAFANPDGSNIALNCWTTQSSTLPDAHPTHPSAVDGIKDGKFGFHTSAEANPWWIVDLGESKRFDDVVIYNRLDEPCASRSRLLTALISEDGENWTELYVHGGTTFGGIDGLPLHIVCKATKARFLKIELREWNFLHLDQVEIFAP
jgi:hypothetical protein